jgi:cell wall-associated NlpC family hydrolase
MKGGNLMSKVNRPLVFGGTAIVGLFLSSSMLLAAPSQVPVPVSSNFKLPESAYIAQVNGSGKEALLKNLGIEKKAEVKVAAVKVAPKTTVEPKVSQEVKNAKAAAVKAKATTVKVASRGGNSTPPVDSGLVGYALSLRGIPYKFGGTTPNGFDCSGYTGYVFAKYGIHLPRTSYEQIKVGTEVSKGDLKPGDLVFFSTYSKGPSHVGIYIGGGQFVHASNSGTRTTSLNDSYYAGRFVGARRVSK